MAVREVSNFQTASLGSHSNRRIETARVAKQRAGSPACDERPPVPRGRALVAERDSFLFQRLDRIQVATRLLVPLYGFPAGAGAVLSFSASPSAPVATGVFFCWSALDCRTWPRRANLNAARRPSRTSSLFAISLRLRSARARAQHG